MDTHIVKVFTKAEELKARTAKVNSDGSFALPWANQPKIECNDCYAQILPHLKELTDEELKEIYLELEHHTYAGCSIARHALGVLNEREILFNAVQGTFHKCSLDQ